MQYGLELEVVLLVRAVRSASERGLLASSSSVGVLRISVHLWSVGHQHHRLEVCRLSGASNGGSIANIPAIKLSFVERWVHVGGLVLELDLLPSQRERQAT